MVGVFWKVESREGIIELQSLIIGNSISSERNFCNDWVIKSGYLVTDQKVTFDN